MRAQEPVSQSVRGVSQQRRGSCDGGVYCVLTAPTTDRPTYHLGRRVGRMAGWQGARLRGVDGTKPFALPGLLPVCT